MNIPKKYLIAIVISFFAGGAVGGLVVKAAAPRCLAWAPAGYTGRPDADDEMFYTAPVNRSPDKGF